MLNLGFTEIMFIVVVAIVIVGPDRLPSMLGWLGRQYGKLMSASHELRQAFVMEAERVEADKRTEGLRRRREEARKRIEAARAEAAESKDAPVARAPTGPTPTAPAEANQSPDEETSA